MQTTVLDCLSYFDAGLCELSLLNQKNQAILRPNSSQLFLLNESIIMNAFKRLENFIENIFLLYSMEKKTLQDNAVISFLKPDNLEHAYNMIKSTQIFIKWNDANALINLAQTYLKDGYPLKLPITSSLQKFNEMRIIRNHVAHNSRESGIKYKSLVNKYYNTVPINIPRPGEFLQKITTIKRTDKMILEIYLEQMWDIVYAISEKP